MRKIDVQQLLEWITTFPEKGITVSEGMQAAMNSYVDSYFKQHQDKTFSNLKSSFDKRSSNLATTLQAALRVKLKEVYDKQRAKMVPQEPPTEKEFIIRDACSELNMTSQNLNGLISRHNLPVRQESARKRYISQSTIEQIKKGKYK